MWNETNVASEKYSANFFCEYTEYQIMIFDLGSLVLRDLNRDFFQNHFSRYFTPFLGILTIFWTDLLTDFWDSFLGQNF